PLALRKLTYKAVWEAAEPDLLLTSESQFRQFHDLNPFLFSYWQLCSGDFTPMSIKNYGRYLQVGEDSRSEVIAAIDSGRDAVICINDGEDDDYQRTAAMVEAAFTRRFPAPSTFEEQ